MLVAHPDDESLWGAGLIIRYPAEWQVICCTVPFHDPERIERFKNACGVLGAQPVILGHPERDGLIPFGRLDLSERDFVVTHGPNGEYGHPQHKECHHGVRADAWFAYGGVSDVVLELTEFEWARKLAAIKCYDNTSPTDRRPKWEALLDYYGKKYDLKREPYGLSVRQANGPEEAGDPAS